MTSSAKLRMLGRSGSQNIAQEFREPLVIVDLVIGVGREAQPDPAIDGVQRRIGPAVEQTCAQFRRRFRGRRPATGSLTTRIAPAMGSSAPTSVPRRRASSPAASPASAALRAISARPPSR
jgi:hypothetical protein